jgi:hypothetical protein
LSVTTPRPGESGYSTASASYSWAQDDQVVLGYTETGYDAGSQAPNWATADLPSGGYSWMTGDVSDSGAWPLAGFSGAGSTVRPVRNALRGFPPGPDDPLPVYPPGPFAAWNRGTDRADAGQVDNGDLPRYQAPLAAATITPDEFDTDYSLPAIKDPARATAGTSTDRRSSDRGGGSRDGRGRDGRGRGRSGRGGSRRGGSGRDSGGSGRSGRSDRAAAGRAGTRTAQPPVPPADAGTTGGRRHGKSARAGSGRSRSRHQPVWLAIGAATVIVVAVVVVLVTTSIGGTPKIVAKPTSPPHTSAPTPKAPAGKWRYIGSRATDPIPLTLRELFPSSFYVKRVYYHVTIIRAGHDCHTALIGGGLQSAVRAGHCTQDLRASYASRLQNAMATIGVFNLATAAGASTAALHAGRAEFVAQLVAKNGVTSKIGQGTGIEEALVKGHYLVLVWAENINLTAPKTNWQRNHLTNFMNTLVDQTINATLSYRMVDGKPQTSPAT